MDLTTPANRATSKNKDISTSRYKSTQQFVNSLEEVKSRRTSLIEVKNEIHFVNNTSFVTSTATMNDIVNRTTHHPIWKAFDKISDLQYNLVIHSPYKDPQSDQCATAIDSFKYLTIIFRTIYSFCLRFKNKSVTSIDFSGRLFGQEFTMCDVPYPTFLTKLNNIIEYLKESPNLRNETIVEMASNSFQQIHRERIYNISNHIINVLAYKAPENFNNFLLPLNENLVGFRQSFVFWLYLVMFSFCIHSFFVSHQLYSIYFFLKNTIFLWYFLYIIK